MPERFEEHRKAPAGMGQAAGNFEGLEHEATAQMSNKARFWSAHTLLFHKQVLFIY